jgi:hypothetical protein
MSKLKWYCKNLQLQVLFPECAEKEPFENKSETSREIIGHLLCISHIIIWRKYSPYLSLLSRLFCWGLNTVSIWDASAGARGKAAKT